MRNLVYFVVAIMLTCGSFALIGNSPAIAALASI